MFVRIAEKEKVLFSQSWYLGIVFDHILVYVN